MRFILLVATLCLPGCMLPYAAPTVSYVPPYDLECPAGEVHVFRVNITRERADAGRNELCELREVGPEGVSKTPEQRSLSCSHGFYVLGPLTYPVSTSHTITVRLYRPGYEAVEIRSWDPPGKIIWKPALTPAVQELALDDVFDLGEKKPTTGEGVIAWPRTLQPGSKSAAHRDALRFGSAEYARLAGQVTGKDASQRELRDRLVDKARRLEKLADANIKARAHAGP